MVTAGFDVAAADVAERDGEHHDGRPVGERHGGIMVGAERRRRARADKDQREGADELGGQGSRQAVPVIFVGSDISCGTNAGE
jgi:hypothetical protein